MATQEKTSRGCRPQAAWKLKQYSDEADSKIIQECAYVQIENFKGKGCRIGEREGDGQQSERATRWWWWWERIDLQDWRTR